MTADDGFLSRWSRRKVDARTPAEPVAPATSDEVSNVQTRVATPLPTSVSTSLPTLVPTQTPDAVAVGSQPPTANPAPNPPADEPAPLTLADVATLGRDSDYSAFVGREVSPEVRNAAMKKLFTDPHYNVMDGLDTYIDDYGKSDPLPPGMLGQLTQTAFLGLFRQEGEDPAQAQALAQSDVEPAPEAPLSGTTGPPDQPRPAPDEDSDL